MIAPSPGPNLGATEVDIVTKRESEKRRVAEAAADLVEDGMIVGLGTGSTARHAIERLGRRVAEGLHIEGIPTSIATAELSRGAGIPLTSLEDHPEIDLAIDGADEVDPKLNLIKGRGGALFREKLVARASRQFVVVVDGSKLVKVLGARAPVPVEVHPFGWKVSLSVLEDLAEKAVPRCEGDEMVRTDNGNYVVDCRFGSIRRPADLERRINAVPGVLENGLFVGMATKVLVPGPKGVRTLTRRSA